MEKQRTRISEKINRVSGYQDESIVSKGIAETHEMVSDTLTEGTIETKKQREES